VVDTVDCQVRFGSGLQIDVGLARFKAEEFLKLKNVRMVRVSIYGRLLISTWSVPFRRGRGAGSLP
jgi:hypothetical protein